VQRCLKLARHEAWEHGQVAKLIGAEAVPGKRTAEERIGEIRALAVTLGLNVDDVCGRLSYEVVVKNAGEASGLGAELTALLWRLGSGFDHGRYWASFSFLERQVVARDADDVLSVRLTSTVEQVMTVAQIPFLLTSQALELFEAHRRSPYQA